MRSNNFCVFLNKVNLLISVLCPSKFNSQICTSKEQSKRLLALGLKNETADMYYQKLNDKWSPFVGQPLSYDGLRGTYLIPAWSLHRLIEMMPESIEHKRHGTLWRTIYANDVFYTDWKDNTPVARTLDLYEHLIWYIEWLIKEGHFNKEYLCEK